MGNSVTFEQYAKAERMLASNTAPDVLNGRIVPQWHPDAPDQFWYCREYHTDNGGCGKQFLLVDLKQNSCQPAFDHERLSAALSGASGQAYDPAHLPLAKLVLSKDRRILRFEADGWQWSCDLTEYRCTKSEPVDVQPGDELLSPNGEWSLFAAEHNLFVRSLITGDVVQLTDDGQPYYDYASHPESRTSAITEKRLGIRLPPAAIWSPDSTKILTYRLDQRLVREMHLVQSVPPGDDMRPVLHTYRYSLVGDEHIALAELVVCDLAERTVTPLQMQPLPVHFISPLLPGTQLADWATSSTQIYIVRLARDHREVEVLIADAATGATRTLFTERAGTYLNVDLQNIGDITPGDAMPEQNFRLIHDGASFLWLSERDGWAHLYLYDVASGALQRQITSGPWVVRHLKAVDEQNGWVYFTAGGREEGRDPYYQHLYRIRLDGSELTLLTPEDAEHLVTLSPGLDYFVDTYSRVDLPPVTVLRAADGQLIRELEQADIEHLLAEGYQLPERFCVKAADGVTDLYGVLIRPAQLEPSRTYPVLDYIYGGVQRFHTPKRFTWTGQKADPMGGAQAFAQLGFAVVIMDGRGTPGRGKAFHDFSYGRVEEAGCLADHVCATRQLAQRYPFIDLDRVGIYGESGGGYASTRAMLTYPDFYKAAVSGCGNHDQRLYISGWGERYHGPYDAELYRNQDNASLAAHLQGKLLLVTGELDDNVHPANTIRMVDSFIKANKDVDLLIMPNRAHSFSMDPYFIRRRWDYFVTHLLGAVPPKEFPLGQARSAVPAGNM